MFTYIVAENPHNNFKRKTILRIRKPNNFSLIKRKTKSVFFVKKLKILLNGNI